MAMNESVVITMLVLAVAMVFVSVCIYYSVFARKSGSDSQDREDKGSSDSDKGSSSNNILVIAMTIMTSSLVTIIV